MLWVHLGLLCAHVFKLSKIKIRNTSFLCWVVFHLLLSGSRHSVVCCSVQSLSRVRLFATPWTTACQTPQSNTNSRSPPKLMSLESVMPSSHFILCHPFSSCLQSLPASFSMSQFLASGAQSIGASASATVLPLITQD